jgi:pimeloyl-ACP methyl ester carboxylesterase
MMKTILLIICSLLLFGLTIFAQDEKRADMRIEGKEHFFTRDGLRVFLWQKSLAGESEKAARAGKIVLLAHGATWTGRPVFDLPIRDYSLMDFLARNGFDVWAIDIHGYGRSDTTDKDWSDTESAARDINGAIDYILKLRGANKIELVGWSWGTLISGLFTMEHPEKVSRLALFGPLWKGSEEMRKLPAPTEQYRINTATAAKEDFVAGQYEEDVIELFAKEALKAAPRSPNGVFLDIKNLPIVDPTRIRVPTLLIHGEKDNYARTQDLLPFFQQLATNDKSYVILPNGGHIILLEKEHHRFQRALLEFLTER